MELRRKVEMMVVILAALPQVAKGAMAANENSDYFFIE